PQDTARSSCCGRKALDERVCPGIKARPISETIDSQDIAVAGDVNIVAAETAPGVNEGPTGGTCWPVVQAGQGAR
ncbi:MAG: hypothetical protein ACK5QX_03215, partial [bacterium]